jgi:HK97 family phage major capsid protein
VLVYLRQLTAERDSLTATATALAETAAGEGRDLTETEAASLASMQSRCAQIDTQLATYGEQVDSQRAYAALRERLTATTDEPPRGPGAALATRSPEPPPTSWGELFVASASFRDYSGRGSSGEVELPGLFERAPIMSSTFPGDLPPYYFAPTPWKQTTPLLDALGRVSTNSNAITWYTWPGAYPVAPVVPEGQTKSEADFTPTPHTAALETYAHYKPLSRQALEDIPQIQSIVEGALRGGILASLEAAAAAALAAATPPGGIDTVTDADLMTGIRIGIGNVQQSGYANPNAVLLNPADFAAIDVAVMGQTSNGPVRTGSIWGVPAIAVGALPVGTAYVGDFKTCVTMFARNTVTSYMTDSHADYFVKNLLVILAEQRALVAVTEPKAASRITVTVGP